MYLKKYVINSINYLAVMSLLISCNQSVKKYYYDNGQLKVIAPLKDGKWHGNAYYYYEDGNLLSTCYFNNDLRQGKGVIYYPNGIIKQIVFYRNDTIMKSATYRTDGTLEVVQIYNKKGNLIDYNYFLDSGKVDYDPGKKDVLFIPVRDTVIQGEIYEAEIRLGHMFFPSIYVYLGDTSNSNIFLKPHIKRIYKEVSILEIDTDTCELGKNKITGVIFETCDTCQGYGWALPFKHEFYVLPVDSTYN